MEVLHHLLQSIIDMAILFFEFVGVAVILTAGIRGVWDCIRRNPQIRLHLATGLAMGLEFKLGGEILRTVIVQDLSEIAVVAAIIALRAALAFLIHWEIKVEKEDTNALKAIDGK